MQANTTAIANVSAVARPLQAPAANAEANARARALRAKAMALALIGRRLTQLSPEQQVHLQFVSKAAKDGTKIWPQWRMAPRSVGGPTTSRSEGLFNGAAAAFVPSTSGSSGAALSAEGLDLAVRDRAITEGSVEPLAPVAAAGGVDVGAAKRPAATKLLVLEVNNLMPGHTYRLPTDGLSKTVAPGDGP